jgi:hypothetical protein
MIDFIFRLGLTIIICLAITLGLRWLNLEINSPWDYVMGGTIYLLIAWPFGRSKENRNPGNNDLFPGV